LKKILVVDDEPDTVRLTKKILENENFEVKTSFNGNDALKLIERIFNDIDLILLDIMMPGKSGFSVLEELKNDERFKKIPVICFTIKNFNEDVQKAKKLGAIGYLTKPFAGKDLIKYIKEKLN
jgi:CheY-like chemotaxis protein